MEFNTQMQRKRNKYDSFRKHFVCTKCELFLACTVKYIDDVMADNNELTARQLRHMLTSQWPELSLSVCTVRRARWKLGWVATHPKVLPASKRAQSSEKIRVVSETTGRN